MLTESSSCSTYICITHRRLKMTTVLVLVYVSLSCLPYVVHSQTHENMTVTTNLRQDTAAIDSWIEFKAVIDVDMDETDHITYKWESIACEKLLCNSTEGQKISRLNRTFTNYDVNQMAKKFKYYMNVRAYRKNSTDFLASGMVAFSLTKTLNADLNVSQNGSNTYFSPPRMFSTAYKISPQVEIFDQLNKPEYFVMWRLFGKSFSKQNTSSINTNLTINQTGLHILEAYVHTQLTVYDHDNIPHLETIDGKFVTSFTMKDPLSSLAYVGNRSYSVGDNITGFFNCTGSGNFNLTVAVINPLGNVSWLRSKSEHCLIYIYKKAISPGIYKLKCTSSNDVSAVNMTIDIHIEPAPDIGVVSVITIFGALIGMFSPVVIYYTYLLDRRKNRSPVEHADFNFQSSYSEDDGPTTVWTNLTKWNKRREKSNGVHLEESDGNQSTASHSGKSNGVHLEESDCYQSTASPSNYGAI